ncbi:hypothetical protein [Rhizobium sp. CCGE 510]|uniref:hypothetical protein n=1 Tax=Rhizobium sp. CCGE 510 TaxID=1132836 RepID=UPI0012F633D7|nr:hypothetical protein [Rhizobium sp. CCGE 510]
MIEADPIIILPSFFHFIKNGRVDLIRATGIEEYLHCRHLVPAFFVVPAAEISVLRLCAHAF